MLPSVPGTLMANTIIRAFPATLRQHGPAARDLHRKLA
jgi:hypothetical protein